MVLTNDKNETRVPHRLSVREMVLVPICEFCERFLDPWGRSTERVRRVYRALFVVYVGHTDKS